MSQLFCREVQKPTAVEFSVKANFTGARHENIILAKSSVLEVYKLKENGSASVCNALCLYIKHLYCNAFHSFDELCLLLFVLLSLDFS